MGRGPWIPDFSCGHMARVTGNESVLRVGAKGLSLGLWAQVIPTGLQDFGQVLSSQPLVDKVGLCSVASGAAQKTLGEIRQLAPGTGDSSATAAVASTPTLVKGRCPCAVAPPAPKAAGAWPSGHRVRGGAWRGRGVPSQWSPGSRPLSFHLAREAAGATLPSPAGLQPQQKAPPLPTLGFCVFQFC